MGKKTEAQTGCRAIVTVLSREENLIRLLVV
jgi:hypothetical protein